MSTSTVKRVLVGRAIASHKLEHQLLRKFLALPVFSSDPLSSNAYATEEMMLVLVTAGAGALVYRIPIALVIATVLVIVIVSYRQTVRAYPSGGGSYIVAHENLGTVPGLVAAAALLIDYVLTVSVSVVAGVLAITSAVPSFAEHKVPIAIGFVILLSIANLRGVKEAGTLFAVPTYGFVAMVFLMLAVGFFRCLAECPVAETADLPLEAHAGLGLFLILRAFSSGSTALTGVEAISNGVQAFRRPQARNAATTLAMMGGMTVTMFLGITVMTVLLHVRVNDEIAASRSVLSQVGETVFGRTLPFFALQTLTAGILILAANTSYQDFPRLSAILARDRFMPSQFKNRGDRLVFSNGIIVLSVLASLLIFVFDADLTRLIQLYVVGVFTAFTLSQAGMVRRWHRTREPGWRRSMIINAVGAVATGLVLVIVAMTKFVHGAWIVIAAMPVIILFFVAVNRHYRFVGAALRSTRTSPVQRMPNTFVLLVSDLGLATADAVSYLRALRPERVIPLYIGGTSEFRAVAERWSSFAPRMGRLEHLPENGGVVRSLRSFLRSIRGDEVERFLTVVVPEELTGSSWLQFARRSSRSRFWLKASLLYESGVVVTNVPLLPEERPSASEHADQPVEPVQSVALVPVSAVHAATARAVAYARSLNASAVSAIYFVLDPEEELRIMDDWIGWGMGIPLSIVEAPFRDITKPVLEEIRKHTSHEGTVVTVVLPELLVRRWWEHLLHNQTALFLKRLLLFEPSVVVTSVPFHLAAGHSRREMADSSLRGD
ncbi:MAG: APC family permease [Actinomycetota bacterium]